MSTKGTVLYKGLGHCCPEGDESWTYARVVGTTVEDAPKLLLSEVRKKTVYARLAKNQWPDEPKGVVEVAILRSCTKRQFGVLTDDRTVNTYFALLERMARWGIEEAVHSHVLPLLVTVPDPSIPKVYHFDSQKHEIGLSFSDLFRETLARFPMAGVRLAGWKLVFFDEDKLRIETREDHYLATFIWVYGGDGRPVMMIHDFTGHAERERSEHHVHFAREMRLAVQFMEAQLAEMVPERAGGQRILGLLVGSLGSQAGQEPND